VNYSARANAEELRELAAGSITANFVAVGATPTQPAYNTIIMNWTDADLYFGWEQEDGLLTRLWLPSETAITIDHQANKKGDDGDLNFPIGRTIYVKRDETPTTKKVTVTYMYGGK